MWPDRVSIPGPLTNESDDLPIALCGPASHFVNMAKQKVMYSFIVFFRMYFLHQDPKNICMI